MTPEMAAGLVESPWEVEVVEEAEDSTPKKRGPYKPRAKKDNSK